MSYYCPLMREPVHSYLVSIHPCVDHRFDTLISCEASNVSLILINPFMQLSLRSVVRSPYQHVYLRNYLLLFLMTLMGHQVIAQCNAPTASAQTITAQICPGTGSINVTSVTGGSGTYEYALYDQANTTVVKPYQNAALIANVTGGNTVYTLRIRSICSSPAGFSADFTKQVTVGGIYNQPIINNVTVTPSQCTNGTITVSASSGVAPLQYALVNSLNDPEPVGTPVRPKQSSAGFTALSAGTYFVRVYDACGSFATQSVTVSSFVGSNPFNGFSINYQPCDQFTGTLSYTSSKLIASPLNDLRVTYPDGSTATVGQLSALGNLNYLSFPIPIAKFGTVGSGAFPDNVGSWPKTFTFTFKDGCGNVFTYDKVFQKPCPPVVRLSATNQNPTCTTTDNRFTVGSDYSCPNYADFGYTLVNGTTDPIEYSLDGGMTWQFKNAQYGDLFATFPYNSSYNICIRYCGQVLCTTGTIPVRPAAVLSLFPVNNGACPGNRSILAQVYPGGGTATMISAPTGQPIVTSTPGQSATDYLFTNLIPGTYIIRYTSICGDIVDKTITIAGYTLNFTYTYSCSGDLNLAIQENPYTYASPTPNSQFRIVNSSGQVVATLTSFPYTFPASTINALPQGEYTIRLNQTGLTCYVEKPITISSSRLSLSQSLFTSACGSTGTVVAIAQGGAGYQYSLYENSTAGSPIAGPQAGNIFNNLDPNKTYVLAVTDNCGRGTNYTTSFSSAKPQIFASSQTMPCPGQSFQLSVNNTPGATYQWFKDNTAIAGATQNVLNFSSVQLTDAGTYKAQVSFGSCVVLTNTITLTPATCGGALPVSLVSFTASVLENKTVELAWITSLERNNQGFLIERSKDLKLFEKVGQVNEVAANSNALKTYRFVDTTPYAGTSYYRLSQTDLDGTTKVFPAVSVVVRQDAYGIFPNPVRDGQFTLNLDEPLTALVKLYTADGHAVSLHKAGSTASSLMLKAAQPLPVGVYVLTVAERGQLRQYRLVID